MVRSPESSHAPHPLRACSGVCGQVAVLVAVSPGLGPQEPDSQGSQAQTHLLRKHFPMPRFILAPWVLGSQPGQPAAFTRAQSP